MNDKFLSKVPQVVTCHAGARDHYQLSHSFDEIGLLDSLVTDFYTPDCLRFFLKKRFNSNLSSKKVSSYWNDFINAYVFKNYLSSNNSLSLRSAQRARKNKSNLFACSYTATAGFNYLQSYDFDARKYLFQLHPHPKVILNILNSEISLGKTTEGDLSYEVELDSDMINSLMDEVRLADAICVASSFTKKTLIDAGVKSEFIEVIPYGVDGTKYKSVAIKKPNQKIRLLFCGQFIHRKGINYLYEALLRFDKNNYELIIVTRGECEENILEKFQKNLNVRVHFNVRNHDLIKHMHQSDVFILPSLYEGFGHVILEAMCAGLPVITTVNTAAVDLFVSGQGGFIGPIADADFLCEKIEFFMQYPKELISYGQQAALMSKTYTWSSFREKIRNFYIQNELKSL
jgi:glycosyltransferase involved in cell wall biosynthesis